MNALHVAIKDLRIFFKDRGAVVLSLLVPLVFVVVFSGALAAIGGGEEDTRIELAVVDLDGGEAADTLIGGLDEAGGVRLVRYEEDEARSLLEQNELSRVLIIPMDFTAATSEGRQATVRLISHPDASPVETEAVRIVVDGVARDMSLEYQIIASLQRMGEMQANAPDEFQVFSLETVIGQARSQFERSREQPLVGVVETIPQRADDNPLDSLSAIQLAAPGFTVLFVFLTAQTAARSIYDEKKVGSFRRLLAAPISKGALLAGKMIPNVAVGLIQTAVIFAFGIWGMRLLGMPSLSLGNEPAAVVLVAVVVAVCSSCLGIFIAAIARTENQIGGLSSVILWVMGILGGSFVPLFLLERFLGPVPMVVPHYWANRAFNDLLIRGLGLADVTTEIAVLLGFAVLFFAIGLWRFDFD